MPTATRLRRDIADLVAYAKRDLSTLLRDIDSPARASEALNDVLPALIDTYGSAAALIAAEWYDDQRVEREVRGSFAAIPAEIPNPGAPQLVGWAVTTATDLPALETLVLGGLQRRIANHSRLTIADSSLADPQAAGWVRVGFGECSWCARFLDGEVRTVPGYDFNAHDNCECEAVPAF